MVNATIGGTLQRCKNPCFPSLSVIKLDIIGCYSKHPTTKQTRQMRFKDNSTDKRSSTVDALNVQNRT